MLGMLKELYLADNVLLTGLVPDYLVLILLDINGTSLYFFEDPQEELPTTESIQPKDPIESPDEIGGETRSINLTVVVISSVGAITLALVGGMIFYFMQRRGEAQDHGINNVEASSVDSVATL
jgi:hypothetical protein